MRRVRNLRIICKVVFLVLMAITPARGSCAQFVPESDPNLRITAMEGPKGMEAFAVGDGLAWAYGKDRLLSVDPQKQQITSVAIEHVKAPFPGHAICTRFSLDSRHCSRCGRHSPY
jgi:hypothetical protein